MKRLLALVRALALVAVVALNAHGLTLAVASWNESRDTSCEIVGAPVVVVESCETGVWLASWGMQ